ncbi:MAG TPA: ankyrin repeat domain-containing protein [Alphaproteobacteria bacterium]|nr:ankyrin repeat domain-containing protein [Alphaproteobacteria bacterium]
MSVTGIDDDDEKWLIGLKSSNPQALNDALFKSARDGDIWRVETALNHGADINFREGRALLGAVSGKHHKIVDFLINKGIDLAPVINDALCEAAHNGDVILVEKFLKSGANANSDNAEALSLAIPRGKVDVFRLLLAAGADARARGGILLHQTISHGHGDAAKLMLQYGADPEVFYRDMNALDWSISIGLRDVSDVIRSGTTGIVTTRDYFTSKSYAALLGENKTYPGHTGLHLAAKAGHFDVVRDKALAEGITIKTEDLTCETLAGQSVLLLLAKTDQLKIIFDPALWVGRGAEMRSLYQNHVPATFHSQIDIRTIAAAVDQRGLKQQATRFRLKPKGPGQI